MYKQYDVAHNRTLVFEDFCAKNQIKLDSKPLVAELIPMVPVKRIELETVHKQRTKNTSVITAVKKSDKKTLGESLAKLNQLFFNYYIKIDEAEKTEAFTHTASYYTHGTDGILFNEASQRIVNCETMGESLTDVGITADDLIKFKEETATFKQVMQRPTEIRKENKILKEKEDSLIKDLDDIFNLRLNKVMSSTFEQSDPELFAAYKLAAKKENLGTRKLAMKGMIKHKETNEPMQGVHIIIPELNIDHKCRGKKGGYQIKNIDTGIFSITVEAKNFKTHKVNLVHNEGETVEMDFLMEPDLK